MLRTTWTSRNLRLNVSLFLAFIAFNAKQKSLTPYIIRRRRRQNNSRAHGSTTQRMHKHAHKTSVATDAKDREIRTHQQQQNNSKKEE